MTSCCHACCRGALRFSIPMLMVAAVASVFFGEAAIYALTAVDATDAAPTESVMNGTSFIVAAMQVRD